MTYFRILLGLGLLLGLLSACGGTQQSPMDKAIQQSETRLHRSLQRADQQQLRQERVLATVRYNPTPCISPEWEVLLFGQWHRMELQPAPTNAQRSMTQLWLFKRGQRWVQGASGWMYPSFVWQPAEEP